MIKVLIISASVAITVSVLTLTWVDRYETTKYELGGIEVYVKENKITGERCTLREGVIGQKGMENLRTAQNFPNWC